MGFRRRSFNKENNNVVGALSVSGRYEMIHQHTLGMVASCAIAIQNEMKIQRINNQLSENVSRLKATFETVSDGILFVSDDKIIQLNNNICDRMLAPVVVYPEMLSNRALTNVNSPPQIRYGIIPAKQVVIHPKTLMASPS